MEHRKQFVISKKTFSHPHFKSVLLSANYYLYYHKDLNVEFSHCRKNVLVGLAFKSTDGEVSADLDELTIENYASSTSDWSGRWIALIDNQIHLDPGGMLGCYYHINEDVITASSSLCLMQELVGCEKNSDFLEIKHGNAMNWFPPPLTILNGVNKLLVGESLSLDKAITENITVIGNRFENLEPDMIFAELAKRLVTIVKNVRSSYGSEIYLPLTAGFDSRTLLAALLNSEVDFSAFTFEHSNITKADKTIPQRISEKFKFSFSFVPRVQNLNEEKYGEYLQHSLGQAADEGILFYAHNQYSALNHGSEDKKILLRGGVWETGRNFYPTIDNSLTNQEDIFNNLLPRFPILGESKLHEKSIKIWINHAQMSNSVLSFRDRFYLEQRVSGWLAALEQANDITGFDRIHPANCQDIINLLSLTAKNPQPEIIRYLTPDLLEIPFNPKTPKESLKDTYYKVYHWWRTLKFKT